MLPENQARTGFLELDQYDKLHEGFAVEVKNEATGKVPQPYAYIQPLLQIGFYRGMTLGEIKKPQWSRVDLKNNVIRLGDADVKNEEGREISLIDGLPELLERIRRANSNAEYVFLRKGEPIGSFRKAWSVATKKAGRAIQHYGLERHSERWRICRRLLQKAA